MLDAKSEIAAQQLRERAKTEAGQTPLPKPTAPDGVLRHRTGMTDPTRQRLFLLALLGPTIAVVLAVVAYPFVYNVVLSLSNMNLYHIRDWRIIGFQQYAAVFAEPAFWSVLVKTIVWTVVNVVFHVGLGVFLAVTLNQAFIVGKSAWRVLLILPWALPQYITALTWRGMFNYEYGAVNLFLTKYLGMNPIAWLTSPFEAFVAVILTNIWLGFPFMMVVALGGLQSIPRELYEAAEVDGASAWRQFWTITAPLLRPVMIPAITLGTVWTFNNINVVWLVTNGGEPNNQTHILVSYVYEAAFAAYRFGWAAALSVVIFAILFLFTQVLIKRTNATEGAY
jgi:arabinogalactan oligomer / maltooligosaccharide transport system permease protein